MKILIPLLSLMLFITLPAAQAQTFQTFKPFQAAEPFQSNQRPAQTNNRQGYTSPSGNRYQYNLNRHDDRQRYQRDINAQRRDALHPGVQRDRDAGFRGGGIQSR